MKRLFILIMISAFAIGSVKAQTANELLGKWKLVKWTKKGKEKDIVKENKTDQVFQVFSEKNVFNSVIGDKEHKGKWKLSKDNKMLTIRWGIFTVDFRIDYFDAKRRVITADQLGTLEYEKVDQ